MPHIKVFPTPRAIRDLNRLRIWLQTKNPLAAQRAGFTLDKALQGLVHYPEANRVYRQNPRFRELIIPFGGDGYIALYEYFPDKSLVHILAVRHQKEDYFDEI